MPAEFRQRLRATFGGTLIVAGNYTRDKVDKLLKGRAGDLLPLARPFITTLTCRTGSRNSLPLATVSNPATLLAAAAQAIPIIPFYTIGRGVK